MVAVKEHLDIGTQSPRLLLGERAVSLRPGRAGGRAASRGERVAGSDPEQRLPEWPVLPLAAGRGVRVVGPRVVEHLRQLPLGKPVELCLGHRATRRRLKRPGERHQGPVTERAGVRLDRLVERQGVLAA